MYRAGMGRSCAPTSTSASIVEEIGQQPSPYDLPARVLLAFGIGTGGDQSLVNTAYVISNAATAAVETRLSAEQAVAPSEMLAKVRETFGLNVKQAASVFNVERPTIYLWATQPDFSRVRPQNRVRMTQLYRLAQKWQMMGRLPNNALDAVFENSPGLFDLLAAPQLDEDAIWACHSRLQAMRGRFDAQQSDNARTLGSALGKAFASIGSRRAEGDGAS
jgi:DNA-binding XRE family transcriptional regulator